MLVNIMKLWKFGMVMAISLLMAFPVFQPKPALAAGDVDVLVATAEGGLLHETQEALKTGADVNARDSGGHTALCQASGNGHFELSKFLLEHGATPDGTDKQGWTPLMYAATGGHLEISQLLISKGANVNATSKIGKTPLILASAKGQYEVVKLLVSKGANVNATITTSLTRTANLH
ncbi:MAG: ankyrin repeat domain-containing protein [Deltaproteobacteria bacterium]|nr:ankyrin repeat domain-containing protein [Deltaproteobacteria bacterium]